THTGRTSLNRMFELGFFVCYRGLQSSVLFLNLGLPPNVWIAGLLPRGCRAIFSRWSVAAWRPYAASDAS
ncbi:MAG: hypothetical protein ACREQV_17730, partial [Candidatus Binatia bacterium]